MQHAYKETKGMKRMRGELRNLRDRTRIKKQALAAEVIKRTHKARKKRVSNQKGWNVSLFSII